MRQRGKVTARECSSCKTEGTVLDEGGDPMRCDSCNGEGWVFIDWEEVMQDDRDAEFKDEHGRYF